MDKQIQLVEEWLADPSSVSRAELKANCTDAYYAAAYAAYNAAAYAAYDAYDAANNAYDAAYYATRATHWVAEYHKEVKEQRP